MKLFTIQHDKEKRDNRGRTPLMLAVTLGYVESVRVLLDNDADVNCESPDGWTGGCLDIFIGYVLFIS